MGTRIGFVQALAVGNGRMRWGNVALLTLAFQARSAWWLLGVWVASADAGSRLSLTRIRMLPAHPDWVLPALVQSVVAALVVVGLARRWRPGWALFAAALSSSVAWAVTFALVPNGLSGYLLFFQPVDELLVTAWLLACIAFTWRRVGRWAAVPVLALVGGVGACAIRLVLTYSLFRVAWPEEWPREMAAELCGALLLALVIAVLRSQAEAAHSGTRAGHGSWSRMLLGTTGLLTLTLAHLAAGRAWASWTMTDSRRLLAAAAVLAAIAGSALLAAMRSSRRRLR